MRTLRSVVDYTLMDEIIRKQCDIHEILSWQHKDAGREEITSDERPPKLQVLKTQMHRDYRENHQNDGLKDGHCDPKNYSQTERKDITGHSPKLRTRYNI